MRVPLALRTQRAIARQVVAMFNDPTRGETPIVRRPDGLFGPASVAWRVHGDVVGMLVGGVSGLLLQMLHPKVLAGVWDHSNFRADMHGRLRRTARFIAMTTYGGPEEATRAIDRVRSEQASRDRQDRDATLAPPAHDSVVAEVEATVDRARVRRALSQLSELQREAVELAYFGGHTYREVAVMLDVAEGTVKSRIRDGLIRLRDELGGEA